MKNNNNRSKKEMNLSQFNNFDIELAYKNFYQSQDLLWGIKSAISPIDQPAIGGLNDAALIYDINDKEYSLCIESIYEFEDDAQEFQYFNNIKKELLKWFRQQNFTLLDDVEYGEHVENWCFVGDSVENVVSQFMCYFNDYFRLD